MRRFLALLAAALVLLAPSVAAYADPDKVPRYYDSRCFSEYSKRFVHDFVGAVGAEWGREIEGAACDVYAKTSAHFVLVAVHDTEGEDIESYALHLFERWGIGAKDRNDGLLLLYVEDYQIGGGGRYGRVEVGYGLEGVVNARVSRETLDAMRDARDQALDAGESEAYAVSYMLAAGAWHLLAALDTSYVDGSFPPPETAEAPPSTFWIIVIVVVILVVIALASSAGSRRRPGWGYRNNPNAWTGPFAGAMVGRTLGGGGLGGGFGGGSFGGGRSGGGGGSGRL